MKKILISITIALLALPALCDTLSHSSGFELWAPDEWTRANRGDQLALLSPDGTCAIFLDVLESMNPDSAGRSMEERLADAVTDFKITEGPRELAQNGLAGHSIQGRGTVDGVAVDCRLTDFNIKEARITIVLTCHTEARAEHGPTIDRIMASLKSD